MAFAAIWAEAAEMCGMIQANVVCASARVSRAKNSRLRRKNALNPKPMPNTTTGKNLTRGAVGSANTPTRISRAEITSNKLPGRVSR